MRRSANDLTERQSFLIRVQQRPDGRYEAWCPTTRQVPPVVASSASMAAARLDDQLQALHAAGRLR